MALAYPSQGGLVLGKLADKLQSDLRTHIALVLEEGKLLEEVRNWEQASVLCTFPAGTFPTIPRLPLVDRTSSRRS